MDAAAAPGTGALDAAAAPGTGALDFAAAAALALIFLPACLFGFAAAGVPAATAAAFVAAIKTWPAPAVPSLLRFVCANGGAAAAAAVPSSARPAGSVDGVVPTGTVTRYGSEELMAHDGRSGGRESGGGGGGGGSGAESSFAPTIEEDADQSAGR